MSDYLKNLQENVLLNESFHFNKKTVDANQLKEDIGDMFTESEWNELLLEIDVAQGFGSLVVRLTQGETTIGAVAAAAAIGWFAAKAVGRATSHSECKKYHTAATMRKCNRIVKNRKKLHALQSKIGLCNNSKEPQDCKIKVQGKINAIQDKLKGLGKIEGVG